MPAVTMYLSEKLYLALAERATNDQKVVDVIKEILEREMGINGSTDQ